MSNRHHSKYHRANHHTLSSVNNLDSSHDPIASPSDPFKGIMVVNADSSLIALSADGDLHVRGNVSVGPSPSSGNYVTQYSTALGNGLSATGPYAFSMGTGNQAYGKHAFIGGEDNLISLSSVVTNPATISSAASGNSFAAQAFTLSPNSYFIELSSGVQDLYINFIGAQDTSSKQISAYLTYDAGVSGYTSTNILSGGVQALNDFVSATLDTTTMVATVKSGTLIMSGADIEISLFKYFTNNVNSVVFGDNNELYSPRSMILGDNNTLRTDQTIILGNYNTTLTDSELGERNIVLGSNNTIDDSSNVMLFGTDNTVASDNTAILAGSGNEIDSTSPNAVIFGGANNYIEGNKTASIAGGANNQVIGSVGQGGGCILGGNLNNVQATNSTIAGGSQNSLSANNSFLGGGFYNHIGEGGGQSVLVGGTQNAVSGSAGWAFIGGGFENNIVGAAATYSSILGGTDNIVQGAAAQALGSGNRSGGDLSTTLGSYLCAHHNNTILIGHGLGGAKPVESDSSNQIILSAENGVKIGKNVRIEDDLHVPTVSASDIVVATLCALSSFVNYQDILVTELSGFWAQGYDYSVDIPASVAPGENNLTLDGLGVSGTSWATFGGDLETKNDLIVSGTAYIEDAIATSTISTDNIHSFAATTAINVWNNLDMRGYSISGIGNESLTFDSGVKISSSSDNIFKVEADRVSLGDISNSILAGGDSSIAGGSGNALTGRFVHIGGGSSNEVEGNSGASNYGTIGGGQSNKIDVNALNGFVGGGFSNSLSANYTSIVGGSTNKIHSGTHSFIGGGLRSNIISGPQSVIAGGLDNTINSSLGWSSIVGGKDNTVEGDYGTVIGGINNKANAHVSIAGGANTNVYGSTSIGLGYTNNIHSGASYAALLGGQNNIIDNGTHSVIGAGNNNALSGSCGIIGAGCYNTVSADNCAIVGGLHNYITGGDISFIGGGQNNYISNTTESFIGGGNSNHIVQADYAAIVGGSGNSIPIINGTYSFIGGGVSNTMTDHGTSSSSSGAVIAGGSVNKIVNGQYSGIVAGNQNTLSGYSGFIGGGWQNTIDSDITDSNNRDANVLVGGNSNYLSGAHSVLVGGDTNAITGHDSFIGGGDRNLIIDSNNAVVVGGEDNELQTSSWCSIVGGFNNHILDSSRSAIVGGTTHTLSSASFSFIGGGSQNVARDLNGSTVAGGVQNIANGNYTSIVGGQSNQTFGTHSTVLGGRLNTAYGTHSIVGGYNSFGRGSYSVSLGYQTSAHHDHSVVIGGTTAGTTVSEDTNTVKLSGTNGITLGENVTIVGNASATKFVGDGSDLTGVVATPASESLSADNLHSFTNGTTSINVWNNLDMQGYSISGIGNDSLAFSSGAKINSNAQGEIVLPQGLSITGNVSATEFVGDGSGLSNLPATEPSASTVSADNIQSFTNGTTSINVWNNLDMQGYSISGIGNDSLAFSSGAKINSNAQGEIVLPQGLSIVGNISATAVISSGTELTSGGGGDVTKVGTPADNQIGVWTGDGTIEGDSNFTWDGSDFTVNGQTTLNYSSTAEPSLSLVSTITGAPASPELELYRNSAAPEDGNYLGQIKFAGENDAGSKKNYAKITGKISDASNGTEDGLIEFALQKAGSNNIGARLTSSALKLINGTALEVDGNITVNGNVDGRDVAADGTTLDSLSGQVDYGMITINLDNGASTITNGTSAWAEMPYNAVIERVTILSHQTGTLSGEIQKDTYGNWPPTNADSILNFGMAGVNKYENSSLTGNLNLSAGDVLQFVVLNVASVNKAVVSLKVKKEL